MNKVLGYIGLCKRANKVSYGEKALDDILSFKSHLCLIAKDMGPNTQKKFIDKCNSHNVPFILIDNSEELASAIGKSNIKCFSINDANFAKVIFDALNKKEGGNNG